MRLNHTPSRATRSASRASRLSVLIVGGGIAGMSAAIAMRRLGIRVEIVELDPDWRVYGAGITLTSPSLRALTTLGIIDDIKKYGFLGDGIQVCTVDGEPVEHIADPAGMLGSGGILRPDLHRILAERVRASGASVRLGVTLEAIENIETRPSVTFSDGTHGTYDLVVGADGLNSSVRNLILPDAPQPEYTGQMIWRVSADRPAGITRRHYFLGGRVKVGLTPVSENGVYVFVVETCARPERLADEDLWSNLHALLEGYGGVIGQIRDALTVDSPIVLRPLEAFLLPPPWHVGRALLIGDAAHPTTPQLASGAGMAIEDALVLAEELERAGEVSAALDGFIRRRVDRCHTAVTKSFEIGHLERTKAPPAEQTQVVADALRILAQPI